MRTLMIVAAIAFIITAAPVHAQQDPAAVERLEQDVQLLKSTVIEQGRRIEALERQLLEKPSASASGAASTSTARPPASGGPPWHDQNAWGRVRNGMSEAQVVSILGRPTSVEPIGGGFKTLFYRGEVSGSGSVSGNVKFNDDRVYMVNSPVF